MGTRKGEGNSSEPTTDTPRARIRCWGSAAALAGGLWWEQQGPACTPRTSLPPLQPRTGGADHDCGGQRGQEAFPGAADNCKEESRNVTYCHGTGQQGKQG